MSGGTDENADQTDGPRLVDRPSSRSVDDGTSVRGRPAAVHPGEVLLVEFLEPLRLTRQQVASDLGIPVRRINEIIDGKRRISVDTALRLARYFGTLDQFWLDLQSSFDLEAAQEALAPTLNRIQPRPRPTS